MKRAQLHSRFLAAVIFILLRKSAFAGEAKVEDVPASDRAPRLISFHADNVSAEKAVELFSKTIGRKMELSTQQGNPIGPTPVIYYDLDIKELPFDSALDRFGKILNRSIRIDQGSDTIGVYPYFPAGYQPNFGPPSTGGPLRVTPQMIARRNALPANSRGPAVIDVSFRVDGSQGQKAFGQPQATVDEAIDDQGKSLSQVRQQFGMFAQLVQIQQFTPTVSFRCPDPPPKRIASLKGTFEWKVPAMMTRVTFSNLHDGKPITTQIDGVEGELSPPQRIGTRWQVNLKLRRGGTVAAKDWNDRKEAMGSSFMQSSVFGLDGKAFSRRGGGSGGGNDETQAQFYFERDSGGDSVDAVPDVLVWEFVKETTPLRVPFAASDLPVP